MKVRVEVVWAPRVERDRLHYGMSDERFDLLVTNLADDPLMGDAKEGGAYYQLTFFGLIVRYTFAPDGSILVIHQVKPDDGVQARANARFLKAATDFALDAAKKGLRKWIGL